MGHVVVFITASTAAEAGRIGQTLVGERLAACANLVPSIASTYWWQGKVEQAGEALLVLKTRDDRLDHIIRRVRELHSYTVPEVVAIPILDGNPDYLRWIDESIESSQSSQSSADQSDRAD